MIGQKSGHNYCTSQLISLLRIEGMKESLLLVMCGSYYSIQRTGYTGEVENL